MKDPPISTLDQKFLVTALSEGKRVDGRSLTERRPIKLVYAGREEGSCLVTLGLEGDLTLVRAFVSAHLTEPQLSRANEGILSISVNFASTAAPRFADSAPSANSEEVVEVTRLLERSLKESRCLDMESLCVIAEEKVWCVKLDILVLSTSGGGVVEAASVAALAALARFKRPEVAVRGSDVTIIPTSEKDPVPLAIHHYPVLSTFAFFENVTNPKEKVVCVDPSRSEELVMEGKLILALNPFREVCCLHLAGRLVIDKQTVLTYSHQSAEYAKTIVNMIKNKLFEEKESRGNRAKTGLKDEDDGETGIAGYLKRLESGAEVLKSRVEGDTIENRQSEDVEVMEISEEPSSSLKMKSSKGVVRVGEEEESLKMEDDSDSEEEETVQVKT